MPASKGPRKTKAPSKGKRVKKSTAAAAVTPAPTPVVEAAPAPVVEAAPAPVVEAVATTPAAEPTVSVSDSLQSEFTELVQTLSGLKTVVSSVSTRLRNLQKRYDRELKSALKNARGRRSKAADGVARKPSGFVKPTLITDELATFLSRESGAMMARTEVTREINKYIRAHNLQDPSNGRIIHPDSALRTLLNVKPSEELTYFNLQRYMSPHFKKSTPAAVSSA